MARVPEQAAWVTVEAGGDSGAQVLGIHGASHARGMTAYTDGLLVCGKSQEGTGPGFRRGRASGQDPRKGQTHIP